MSFAKFTETYFLLIYILFAAKLMITVDHTILELLTLRS